MRLGAVLAAAGLLACVFFSAGLEPLLEPLLYTMTPLQRYYAGDYLVSSWGANDPTATTRTRLLWKSRPAPPSKPASKSGRPGAGFEREFALERDVRPRPLLDRIGKYDAEPFLLSDDARAEGWTAVNRDSSHRVTLPALHGFLKEGVYDGHPLWRFFVQPMAGAGGLLVLALALRLWRRRLLAHYPWRTGREAMWLAAREWSAASAARLSEGRRVRKLEGAKLETRQLPAPHPAPVVAVGGTVAEPKAKPEPLAAPRPVSVPPVSVPSISVPPAAVPTPRAYAWSETEGID